MRRRYAGIGVAILGFLAASCSLQILPQGSSGSQNQATNSSTSTAASLTLAPDSNGQQAALLTGDGSQIPLLSVTSDGTSVKCIAPLGLEPISDGPGRTKLTVDSTAIVVGTTADGKPGAWIYDAGKVEGFRDEGNGRITSELPESKEHDGIFRGPHGWVYHVMGVSGDGKMIIGYAENLKGFRFGRVHIQPGTTVGVYWTVSRDHRHRHFVVSQARIIGALESPKGPRHGRDHERFLDKRVKNILDQLKLLFLDRFTSYLIMVEKNGITYDAAKRAYVITGTDQDNNPATATIDAQGNITIAETAPTQGPVDLFPASITPSAYSVQEGSSLPVTLTLENLQAGSFSSSFSVNFYLATTAAFTPPANPEIGTVTVSGIGGNATVTVSATLTIPSLGTNTTAYIYADVDPTHVSGDVNTSNNISTTTNAAVVLVYQAATPQSYNLYVQTYSPTGSGSVGTGLALFKDNGNGTMTAVDISINPGAGYLTLNETSNGAGALSSGKYYVAVVAESGSPVGAYGLEVYTPNTIVLPFFSALTSDPNSTGDNIPTFPPSIIAGKVVDSVPKLPVALNVGSAVNWYLDTGDYDWFTFTLP